MEPIAIKDGSIDAGLAGARRISLQKRPLAPWLRHAHVQVILAEEALRKGFVRVLRDFELILQLEGSTWIWSGPDHGSVSLRPGELAFIPPRFLHAWAHMPGRHIAVHFDLHAKPEWTTIQTVGWKGEIEEAPPLAYVPCFALSEVLSAADASMLVLPLVTRVRAPRVFIERLMSLVELSTLKRERTLRGLLRASQVLGWVLGAIAEEAAHAGLVEHSSGDRRILRLLQSLDTDVRSSSIRPSVADLARDAGMSLTTFREVFVRTVGRTPRDFLEGRRIERAARALWETERKIQEVARAEGYDDPYHFSRVFRRVMGTSPRQYRRKMRAL